MPPAKNKFNLDDLTARALASNEERHNIAVQELDRLTDVEAWNDIREDWRQRQLDKLRRLEAEMTTVSSAVGAVQNFRFDTVPNPDAAQVRILQRQLSTLAHERSRIKARADSIVADEDGNVALTAVQLAEFFGL